MRYYHNPSPYFSEDINEKLLKLGEGRIREFKGETVLEIFSIYLKDKKIDNFYLESFFVPLFKNKAFRWDGNQLGRIFRYLMIVDYEVGICRFSLMIGYTRHCIARLSRRSTARRRRLTSFWK